MCDIPIMQPLLLAARVHSPFVDVQRALCLGPSPVEAGRSMPTSWSLGTSSRCRVVLSAGPADDVVDGSGGCRGWFHKDCNPHGMITPSRTINQLKLVKGVLCRHDCLRFLLVDMFGYVYSKVTYYMMNLYKLYTSYMNMYHLSFVQ